MSLDNGIRQQWAGPGRILGQTIQAASRRGLQSSTIMHCNGSKLQEKIKRLTNSNSDFQGRREALKDTSVHREITF